MYEVFISSSMLIWITRRGSTGSIGACLDVKVAHLLRMAGDEVLPRGHVVAHQLLEDLVREHRVLDPDLFQNPGLRVHGGGPELARIHLAEALVPLDHGVL